MANVISCPKCERQLRVPDELLGQNVKCPSCSETFTAEVPARQPPSSSSSRPSPPPPRDDDEDDRPSRRRPPSRRDDDDDDYERPARRRHLAAHRGDTIQLLGILSFFFAPLILGPMAWVMGNNDLKEMDAGRMDPAGRSATNTGKICGMIATIISGVVFVGVFSGIGFCFCCVPMMGAAGGGGHH